MGVDYSAVLFVGQVFEDREEAVEFLKESGFLLEQEYERIEEGEDCLEDVLYDKKNLQGFCLNAYTGYGFIIGYSLSCSDPEAFKESFDKGVTSWNETFPSSPCKVIREVHVY